MPIKWCDRFIDILQSENISFRVLNRVHGWIETASISGKSCYIKSATFNIERSFYFQGVDPNKLNDKGDIVVICGGYENNLKDIFIIPWVEFFRKISSGKAINTYKLPKVYNQYKFKIKSINNKWNLSVQGSVLPDFDVTAWCYSPNSAIEKLKPYKSINTVC